MVRAALVAAAVTGVPRFASACTGCADEAIDFLCPWVWPVSLVLLAWLGVGWWRWSTLTALTAADAAEPGRASPNAVMIFSAGFAVAMGVGMSLLLPHTGLMLALCAAWLAFVVWSLARSWRRQTWPAPTRLFHRMNGICLVLALVAAGTGWITGRQPSTAVRLLHNPNNSDLAFPYVVRAGESVVPLLIEDIDRWFDTIKEPLPPYYVTPQVLCLTRIGGEESARAITRLIETRIHDSLRGDGRWQLVVACLFAEFRGSAAVPVLRELYDREPDEGIRQIALCALARTGDRQAILFAVDHLAEMVPVDFGEESSIHELTSGVVSAVAGLLATSHDPALLREARLFSSGYGRRLVFGLPTDEAEERQGRDIPDAALTPEVLAAIRTLGPEEQQALRAAWDQALAGPTDD